MKSKFTVLLCLFLCCAQSLLAQYDKLYEFGMSPDGINPSGTIVKQGNTLYGGTFSGGSNGDGCLYKVNTDGTGYKVLYNFAYSGAALSIARLSRASFVLLSHDTLFVLLSVGGTNNRGGVISIKTDGTDAKEIMTCTYNNGLGYAEYGAYPVSALLVGKTMFVLTSDGGSKNTGALFKVNTDGTELKTLHYFTDVATGQTPSGSLVRNGKTLYGTFTTGGANNKGGVFQIDTTGTDYSVVYSFDSIKGATPRSSLWLNGNLLYGISTSGGAYNNGTVFSLNTTDKTITNIHDFDGAATGQYPSSITLYGNAIYGTTGKGGSGTSGIIYRMSLDGSNYEKLYDFSGLTDGFYPTQLYAETDTLFGITTSGGTSNSGVVYSYALPQLIEPTITWTTPADIYYGTKLSNEQLNASSNVDGKLSYTPPAGTLLLAGNNQSLSTVFTPNNTLKYKASSKSVAINVRSVTDVVALETENMAYPNPARDYITIKTMVPLYSIELFDESGKLVYQKNGVNQNQQIIEMESFKTGIYRIVVTDASLQIILSSNIILIH